MRRFVAPIIAGLITLIGCGNSAAMPPTTPTAASSVAASGALTTAPTTVPRPPESAQPVTILGVIRPGALPGCNVLHADNGTHYVLLDTTDPPRNIPIEVIGVLDTSLVSYCNSGQPLHVQRISQP
ncbi:MAG: hypothetical protein H0V41_01040 [Pseudonocardiales bacterium]|nr:hypothetical protein [Pseudonocardiales bacterium]